VTTGQCKKSNSTTTIDNFHASLELAGAGLIVLTLLAVLYNRGMPNLFGFPVSCSGRSGQYRAPDDPAPAARSDLTVV
jgi:hypothetical protein